MSFLDAIVPMSFTKCNQASHFALHLYLINLSVVHRAIFSIKQTCQQFMEPFFFNIADTRIPGFICLLVLSFQTISWAYNVSLKHSLNLMHIHHKESRRTYFFLVLHRLKRKIFVYLFTLQNTSQILKSPENLSPGPHKGA